MSRGTKLSLLFVGAILSGYAAYMAAFIGLIDWSFTGWTVQFIGYLLAVVECIGLFVYVVLSLLKTLVGKS